MNAKCAVWGHAPPENFWIFGPLKFNLGNTLDMVLSYPLNKLFCDIIAINIILSATQQCLFEFSK